MLTLVMEMNSSTETYWSRRKVFFDRDVLGTLLVPEPHLEEYQEAIQKVSVTFLLLEEVKVESVEKKPSILACYTSTDLLGVLEMMLQVSNMEMKKSTHTSTHCHFANWMQIGCNNDVLSL
ncbi:hypothetical protein Tco_0922934 [Tanacetum coccineum]|uniref:Uncharacterized protein n=1 Tax=Tanacetum coccineum TaxID=301880 RepID=A0ABQ5D0U9_9ASTR